MMASLYPMIFLLMVSLAPSVHGKADYVLECVFYQFYENFIPCGNVYNVTLYPQHNIHMFQAGTLRIKCEKFQDPTKKIFENSVFCCLRKDCIMSPVNRMANLVMQCVRPMECNILDNNRLMKPTTCTMHDCTFHWKTFS
ncbi:hypothetical protein XENTR_v10023490 [Xenopus tropicalis]|nr:hypothetical protein XENTR_v10023490 [Xenopus tropicalis]